MAESGELTSRTIARSADMNLRFRSYGTIAADRWPTRLDLRMPFYYLSSQTFGESFTSDMHRATSPETCDVCDLYPEFFELLGDASFRIKARIAAKMTPNNRPCKTPYRHRPIQIDQLDVFYNLTAEEAP